MRSPMDHIRQYLGHLAFKSEHEKVDRRLEAQRVRLNTLDAAIEAQNAAPPKSKPKPAGHKA